MSIYLYERPNYDDDIMHHRYISREMGPDGKYRYIYPGDTKQSIGMRDAYLAKKAKLKRLRERQKKLEGKIASGDDDTILKTGDKMDSTLNRIEKVKRRMKKMRKEYSDTTGKNMRDQVDPTRKSKYKKQSLKELKAEMNKLSAKKENYSNKVNTSSASAKAQYAKSETSKGKNDRQYQVSGIQGKMHESEASRYGAKTNTVEARMSRIQKEIERRRKLSKRRTAVANRVL